MSDEILRQLQEWLEQHWDPEVTLGQWWARLADAGWGHPHFPGDWFGRDLSPALAGEVSRAIRDHGAVPAPVGFGPNMAAPTVLDHGTTEQKARHLPGIVTGVDAWCQLFSEPNAGSDLAGLQCRAERDGDVWRVSGQKVWTSSAQIANKAMLLARTDVDVPKHAGISYFFLDLDQPGVEIRPIREITGRAFFNEVFLDEVVVPDIDLIGGEGNGWAVANTTLAYERGRRSTGGVGPYATPGPIAGDLDQPAGTFARPREMGGAMPSPATAARLADLAVALDRHRHPSVRQDLARLHVLERIIALNGARARALAEQGGELPGLPNLTKMAANHLVRLAREVTFDVLAPLGTLYGYEPEAVASLEATAGLDGLASLVESAIFASAPPIYGGSDQIQRNIVGERVLGLGREPTDERGVPFRQLRQN